MQFPNQIAKREELLRFLPRQQFPFPFHSEHAVLYSSAPRHSATGTGNALGLPHQRRSAVSARTLAARVSAAILMDLFALTKYKKTRIRPTEAGK